MDAAKFEESLNKRPDKKDEFANGIFSLDIFKLIRATTKYVSTEGRMVEAREVIEAEGQLEDLLPDFESKVDERLYLIFYWVGFNAGAMHKHLKLPFPAKFRNIEKNVDSMGVEIFMQYARGFFDGYNTDNDRVDIMFGPPDQVYEHDEP